MTRDLQFTLDGLRTAYAAGLAPAEVLREMFRRIEAQDDPGMFLHLAALDDLIAAATTLGRYDPALPLWGMPFAVKDNIDVAGMPTTAACPGFAYQPVEDAPVVARLRAAGAIPVGKTNLDQFATGLVGVRTPHPVPRNTLDPRIVPGGSSSGSAVSVAAGIVPFALGTDTAGSGRVPAALNNIVGLKPSLGAISTRGVVPACRTLDCVSVFALTVGDAYAVYRAAAGFDPADPYARQVPVAAPSNAPPEFVVGVPTPESLRFFGDALQQRAFDAAVAQLEALGARRVPVDLAPFFEVAEMLYAGPWVAERFLAAQPMLARDADMVHPVIRQILGQAEEMTAADTFRALYRLEELRRALAPVLAGLDLLCVPSIPTFYRLQDLAADPIGPNSRLGTYTNFVNLLDLCGLSVPLPARADGRPGSVTLLAASGRDGALAAIGARLEQAGARTLGATGWPVPALAEPADTAAPGEMEIVVCGAHMSGLPLNGQLTSRAGRFLRAAVTTPDYRLYRLPGGSPARPGLVRSRDGAAIAVEVWALPEAEVGSFLAGIPSPLGLGTLTLADGSSPKGFLCEAFATAGAEDVTHLGDWRRVLAEAAA